MFGFVAYQLWGTGLQTARAQSELDSQFTEFLVDNGITPATLAPATTTTTIDPVTGSTLPVDGSTTTTVALLPPETVAPSVQDYGSVSPGDGLFRMKIPRIGIDYNVVAGVTAKDLTKGPGHFPDTNLPGQLGNAAVAGHRTGHGGPFIDLDKLSPGDEIQVFTRLGDAYAYIVTDVLVVNPTDYQVVSSSDPNVATLTLITCTPKYTSKQRLVVHATLDTSRGSPVGAPLIFYGQDEPIPVDPVLPADDSTDPVVATSPVEATTAGTADTAGTTVAPASPTTSTTAPAVIVSNSTDDGGTAANPFAGEDAFTQGWFDDSDAWLHVIGWGALLALVAYASFRVAKRFRHLYLAFVVGFVPMVVVLYFFYENVNRLLPAAI